MKAVYFDGFIYVGLAWATFIMAQLNDDGTFQSSHIKLIIGSIFTIFLSLKTFRSTSFADSKAETENAKPTQDKTPTPVVVVPMPPAKPIITPTIGKT